jgi:hypothetical protein
MMIRPLTVIRNPRTTGKLLARELGVSENELDPEGRAVDPTTGERVVELEQRVAGIENRLTRIEDALKALRGAL